MDINNCLNKVLPSFDSLNKKLSPGFCLVDTFLDYFPFVNWKSPDTLTSYYNRLSNILENSPINQNIMLIIADASIKNKVATLVSHIYRGQEIIAKFIY